MAIEIGQAAPDFTLRDQHGQEVTLSGFAGRRSVVLVFYPYAFSRVCTGEMEELRDQLAAFQNDETAVLAVSCDPMFTLRAFAEHEQLGFPLLSDFWPHGEVSSAYGVFDSERGCSQRATFIVDRSGTVAWRVLNAIPDARDIGDYKRVLAGLAEATVRR